MESSALRLLEGDGAMLSAIRVLLCYGSECKAKLIISAVLFSFTNVTFYSAPLGWK